MSATDRNSSPLVDSAAESPSSTAALVTPSTPMSPPTPSPCEADLQARLEDFARATSGWFWEMDADLRFIYFSESVEAITGVPPQWHYGKTREELGASQGVTSEDWQNHLETLRRHESFQGFEFKREGPDGVRWMATSGHPIHGPNGEFRGYRGVAADITPRIEAEQKLRRLAAAIENLSEMFALWDPDDQLVMCNARFRELNEAVSHTTVPGVAFETHLREALAAGLYPQAAGHEEQWLNERITRHQHPTAPIAVERQDGRWILIAEHRLPDGSTATVSTDISAQKRAERILAEQHEVLDTALKTIPDGVQVMDENLNLLAWNEQLFAILDLDAAEILSATNPGIALHRAMAERGEYGRGGVNELLAGRRAIVSARMEIFYEWQLASGKWVECRGNPVEGGGYVSVYRDVTEHKTLLGRLEGLASTDALTGSLNRRKFLEVVEVEFRRARRHGHPTSLLILDVDHFKTVNDTYGHMVGDAALRYIVECCNASVRVEDNIGRIGGEEFAVLAPETSDVGARVLADRIRSRIADQPLVLDDLTLPLTVSIGVAQLPDGEASVSKFMACADEALYNAKRTGRNKVCCWSERLDASA